MQTAKRNQLVSHATPPTIDDAQSEPKRAVSRCESIVLGNSPRDSPPPVIVKPNKSQATTKTPPFHGLGDILYRDESLRLSLSTAFSMDPSTWNISTFSTNETCYHRRNILVKEVEARLDCPQSQRSPLEIEEIKLHVGPSLPTSRMVTAHQQSPSLTDIRVSGSSHYREYGVTLGSGYPQLASVGAVAKWGQTLDRPLASIGLDLSGVQLGIENGNQFYWRYPVSRSQEYLKKSATFFNHSGTIVYPSTAPPEAMRVKALMTCGIPKSCTPNFTTLL